MSPGSFLLLFFALTVPFGIAVHLASEFASPAWFVKGDGCSCAFCSRERRIAPEVYRYARALVEVRKPLARYALALAVRPPPAFLLVRP
ncbi:MAG: hypothetical protein JO165_06965 [Candidatus Eremiobacteraeota bacterium]|nr:hypothetical protein [Candidatus Eremiobacteraeota bacterium]